MAMDIPETGPAVGRVARPDQKASSDKTSVGLSVDGTGVPSYKLTGTHINYFFVCKRKLWLFEHGITMEHTSDTVLLGKLIDESSYERQDKRLNIDGSIVIDWFDEKTGVIHEVKKSDRMEEAHTWQVLYYLWFLKQRGMDHLKGEIDYPKLKQKVEVILTAEREEQLHKVLSEVEKVLMRADPPERLNRRFCKSCSYVDFCWGVR